MKATVKKFAMLSVVLSLLGFLLASGTASADSARSAGVVNINTADLEQLQLLPGIGLSKARAIVDYRQKQRFGSPDDLIRVKGIGQGLLKKIRRQVVVKGTTTAKVPPKKKRSKRKK